MLKRVMLGATSMILVLSSIGAAQAQSGRALSLTKASAVRASTNTLQGTAKAKTDKLAGGGAGSFIAIFGSVAALLGFLEAVGAIDIIGSDDDDADSN